MTETAPELRLQALALAATLPALLAEARHVAVSLRQGAHGRRRAGPGESFWQFRRHQRGDSAADVDWRQSAKSDRLYVRESEWTTSQTVWLWVDPSPSMRWRSGPALPEKRWRGLVIGVALAFLLQEGGERVALLGGDVPPVSGRAGIDRLAATLLAAAPTAALPVPPPGRRGHVVLISDFLAPAEAWGAALRAFAATGGGGYLLQILDPAEESLPYSGRVRFRGLEGEGELLAPRAEDLRAAYATRLAGLRADLAGRARALGWGFSAAITAQPPAAALTDLFSAIRGG